MMTYLFVTMEADNKRTIPNLAVDSLTKPDPVQLSPLLCVFPLPPVVITRLLFAFLSLTSKREKEVNFLQIDS